MKYWKGKKNTNKNGQCGTRDDGGFVPDSVECTKEEYDLYISSLIISPVPEETIKLKNKITGEITEYIIM